MKNLFISDQNQVSKRWCILEDDGKSAWLYITEPENEKPVGDAFVYNRIDPIPKSRVKDYSEGPPPIRESHASDQAQIKNPNDSQFSFIWSNNGESVALLSDLNPVAMIIDSKKHGYSKGVALDGPWGHPWDQNLYDRIFPGQAGRGKSFDRHRVMQSQDYPTEYFQLMVNVTSALAGFPAQILQQSYTYESFGSWWFSFGFKGQEFRVVFDGKDGNLFLQKKVASDWNEIQSRQTREPNGADVLNFIGEGIKRP